MIHHFCSNTQPTKIPPLLTKYQIIISDLNLLSFEKHFPRKKIKSYDFLINPFINLGS